MTLAELTIKYRVEHGLSQRAFCAKCGISAAYISMLERGVNPATGKPLIPQLPQLKKIADGMGMTLDELFRSVDDTLVSISSEDEKPVKVTPVNAPVLSERELALLDGFRRLNTVGQDKLMDYLDLLLNKAENLKGDSAVQVS